MRYKLLIFLWALCGSAFSEIYRDIGPLDSFGDVKEKLPAAQFLRQSPAWAKEEDALYKVSGNGLSGTIIIKFFDSRPWAKSMAEKTPALRSDLKNLQIINQTDDEALTVSWVRWVPDNPFPLQRLIAKYGVPEKSEFSNEDYVPLREWERKGLIAYLTDDEKLVVRIDFVFTREEQRRAWQKRYNYIPEWLAEDPIPVKRKP